MHGAPNVGPCLSNERGEQVERPAAVPPPGSEHGKKLAARSKWGRRPVPIRHGKRRREPARLAGLVGDHRHQRPLGLAFVVDPTSLEPEPLCDLLRSLENGR